MDVSDREKASPGYKGGRTLDQATERIEEIVRTLGEDPDPNPDNIKMVEEATELLYWCLENLRSGEEVNKDERGKEPTGEGGLTQGAPADESA